MDPQTVGRFRILSQEGKGGMGVVLLGVDEALERKAAVKLLSPDRMQDPKSRARFQREATAVARLKHPNIAALYETGEHEGQPYLAIEWIEGESLAERLTRGRMALGEALPLLGQILDALDYAHDQGVVHRDIKPSNIMLGRDGRVTLVDFGLAFLLSEPGLTSTGVLLGTPLYLAPEMAGDRAVDGKADLYSAALVFFEMVTGEPPFKPAHPAELISQHLHAPRPVLSEVRPDLPVTLDPVLEKAMACKPEDRYPSGHDFWQAVKEATRSPEPPPPPRRARLAVAVGLLLVLLGVGFARLGPRPAAQRRPAVTRTPSSSTEPEDWTMRGGDAARSNSLGQTIERAEPRWSVPLTQVRSVVLGSGTLVVSLPDATEARSAATGKRLWRIEEAGEPIVSAGYDPELVILARGTHCRAFHLSNGKPAWERELRAPGPGGVLSDDATLYMAAGSWLQALDPGTGDLRWELDLGEAIRVAPVADEAGLFVATESAVVGIDTYSQEKDWEWEAPSAPACLALAAEQTVLVGCEEGQVDSLSMLSGKSYWESTENSGVAALAVTEGTAVAACREGDLVVYDMPEGGLRWQVNPGAMVGPPLTDGEQVVVATREGMVLSLGAGGMTEWMFPLACTAAPVPGGYWLYLTDGRELKAYSN